MKHLDSLVTLVNVTHSFDYQTVLLDCNWKVGVNQTILLLGKNGAGKTTLLTLLAGLMSPSQGEIKRNAVLDHRASLFLWGGDHMFYEQMTVLKSLVFWQSFAGEKLAGKSLFEDVLAFVGLGHAPKVLVRNLSRGMLQRLIIARMILLKPAFLLLDEPTIGLDKEGMLLLKNILEEKGCLYFGWKYISCICAEHNYNVLSSCFSHLAYIDHGNLFSREFTEENQIEVDKVLYV